MATSDKLIGTLRLDLSQLESEVQKANTLLKSLGQGVNLDLSKEVMHAVEQKLIAITKAAENYGKKMAEVGSQTKQGTSIAASAIQQVTKEVTALNGVTGAIREVREGFDSAGAKIREVMTEIGIVSQTVTQVRNVTTQAEQIKQLVSLYNQMGQAWSKMIAAESAGKTGERDQWAQRTMAIQQEISALLALNPELEKNAQVRKANQAAADALAMAYAKAADAQKREQRKLVEQNTDLKQAERTYKELKTAVQDYRNAMKAGSESGMQEAATRIQHLEYQIAAYEQVASQLDKQSKEYKEITALIERMKTAYQQYVNLTGAGATGAGTTTEDPEKKFENSMNRIMSLAMNMILYRGLRKFWTEAKSFATEYYNTIKEIQVVTQSTDAEMETISQDFRRMAQELNVSLTEISQGAVIFFRQGLSREETENRLSWATKFAKISGTGLEETAQYITAVLNSMQSLNGDAQRVVDVFTYMGDNAATSGAEIATAMQKAAATADNAGMEFEFLAAAIASVSATTRQAPESIGTAFNTMMARLHSIKQKGYNDEDETKINDVAKALDRVGISLMDSNGEWRDFDSILVDISRKWDTMTDKQQAYIATTMAGVRAQNYFIALMNDMAKGPEGGSTMWALYQGAKGSQGIVDEKYTTWLTGVEAAQNRLTLAVQKFYDALNADSVFTGLFSNLATFIEFLNRGLEATNGWSAALPVLLGLLGGLITAFGIGVAKAGSLGVAISNAFSAHPVVTFILALTAVVTLCMVVSSAVTDMLSGLRSVKDTYGELVDASSQKMSDLKSAISDTKTAQKEFTDRAKDIERMKDRYVELSTKVSLTAEEEDELNGLIQDLIELCPGLRSQLDQTTGSFKNQQQAVASLNQEIEKNYQLAQLKGQHEARTQIFGQLGETSKSLTERRRALENPELLAAERDFSVFYNNLSENDWAGVLQESANRNIAAQQVVFERWATQWINSNFALDPVQGRRKLAEMYGLSPGAWSTESDIVTAAYGQHADYAYNIAQLESDTQDLINASRTTLAFFEDTVGLSSGVLEGARAEAEAVYADVEQVARSGLLTSSYLDAKSREMTGIWANAKEVQRRIDTDETWNAMARNVESAREKYDSLTSGGGTTEEIKQAAKDYNEAATEFNNAYKTATGTQKDVYSLIKDGEEDLSRATDAVNQQMDALDVVEQRRALRRARETGFSEQREDLYNALYDQNGKIDRLTYKRTADEIKRRNPLIWEAMMADADFATLDKNARQGVDDGKGFISDTVIRSQAKILADTTDHWNAATEAAEEYYSTVEEGTETIATDAEMAQELLDAYEEGGTGGVIDKYNALMDTNGDFTAAFMARHPEIAAMMNAENGEIGVAEDFDPESWLADLNAIIPGTTENILGIVDALGETGITAEQTAEAASNLLDVLGDPDKLANLNAEWSDLSETQKKVLKTLGVDESKFKGLKAGSKELQTLKTNLQGLKTKSLESMNRVLNGTNNAVNSLNKGTKDWVTYQKTLFQSVDTATKLQGAYEIVLDKSKEGTDEYTEALAYLSQQTGMTTEQLTSEGGMAQALLYIQQQTGVVQNSVAALAGTLLSMEGVSFDPSNIVNGYISLGAGADAASTQVANLVNTVLQMLGATIDFVPDGTGGGHFVVNGITGKFTPTSKKQGGGGGGGGGGGSKDSFSDRLSVITAQMGRSVDKYKEMLERLSLYESMYSDQGELTNILRVQEQRRQVLIDQQEAYEKILEDMPGLIEKAKEELANYKEDTEDYKKALSTLQSLEDSYASYTQELIKNRAEQLKNADAIRETQEAIVQLESNLRNTIQSVIMDREDREKASLSARISMEGDVLDAIKNRYEQERNEIIETTDLRIKSLEDETDALSDALDERKKLAEDQDKWEELLQLQDQYSRIIADPTRAKEAKEIAQKIADLQEEIGWTTAEREVEAQQKIIDEQLRGLEDYEEATNKFYDELLKDPRNFMEEYNNILAGTDAEIINWLTENSDNYLKATDAARQELLQGWQDTLDELRMYTRTVWDEVEAIINLGDSGIMQFLVENSQAYREGNAYEQMDLIYGWTEMLRDWHAAYVDTFQDLEYMEFTNTMYDWVTYLIAQHKAGGGGGGGTRTKDEFVDSLKGQMDEDDIDLLWDIFNRDLSSVGDKTSMLGNRDLGSFASGGLAYGTGLAHLDGTAGLPERVLSPEQTAAFERLVDFITSPARVSVPGISGGMIPPWENGGGGAYFGDINISVESLNSDTDIDNLADRLMDSINERMTRGMVVGGVAMGY